MIITSELTAQTTGGYTITEIQVADLTSQGRLCELTLSTDQPASYLPVLRKIGATLHRRLTDRHAFRPARRRSPPSLTSSRTASHICARAAYRAGYK